jgi:RES domain-containing protein
MGRLKSAWEEESERGWSAPDKVVCSDCVEDSFLKELIDSGANSRKCDYCGRRARHNIAAPVELIMPAIASALNFFYAEPTSAGVPYDSGWVVEPRYTQDVLSNLSFDGQYDLFEDVVNAFHNTAWVNAANGHWASIHQSDEWSYAWVEFSSYVKHRSRYFFMPSQTSHQGMFGRFPADILEDIGRLVTSLGLINSMPSGTMVFRVRERIAGANWELCEAELGAPPQELAAAGRMNPAGISYLYLATERRVAIGEVMRSPPCNAAIGRFKTAKSLLLLDLTCVPDPPSLFDEDGRWEREAIMFLSDFVRDISQPVRKDGREHISYVPSQVVSEYFSQVFRTPEGERLDGLVYPSAVQSRGKNVVLFPLEDMNEYREVAQFIDAEELILATWGEMMKALNS